MYHAILRHHIPNELKNLDTSNNTAALSKTSFSITKQKQLRNFLASNNLKNIVNSAALAPIKPELTDNRTRTRVIKVKDQLFC